MSFLGSTCIKRTTARKVKAIKQQVEIDLEKYTSAVKYIKSIDATISELEEKNFKASAKRAKFPSIVDHGKALQSSLLEFIKHLHAQKKEAIARLKKFRDVIRAKQLEIEVCYCECSKCTSK